MVRALRLLTEVEKVGRELFWEGHSAYYVRLRTLSLLPLTNMRLALLTAILCISTVSVVSAQVTQSAKKDERSATGDPNKVSAGDGSSNETANTKKEDAPAKEEAPIFIHLVGGGRMEVQEVQETADGIWYKRGNVETFLDPKRVARIERPTTEETKTAPPERLTRSTSWRISDAEKIEKFFLTRFGRPLPTSAFGQSDIHNRWGLDHRQGIDVGLHPDSREGLALQEFLRQERIPYMAFRGAIPGVATGPHIHIGNPSPRYLPR